MKRRILSVLLCIIAVSALVFTVLPASAAEQEDTGKAINVKTAILDREKNTLTITLANTTDDDVVGLQLMVEEDEAGGITYSDADYYTTQDNYGGYSKYLLTQVGDIGPGSTKEIILHPTVDKDVKSPEINCMMQYLQTGASVNSGNTYLLQSFDNILKTEDAPSKMEVVKNFIEQTGFSMIVKNWRMLVMLLISFVLIFLAIVKKYEPLLLLPIAFGMLLTNLPGAEMFHEQLFANGHVHWELFTASENFTPGLVDYLYLGVKLGIYPCLIFLGVGAMTDFGPLIANPKSLLLGAAAQLGIFVTYVGARLLSFTSAEAASIGIIGGADGPTAIYVTTRLAPWLLGPIAVAAYSYMALVPVIQPPIMKLLTTKKERNIVMKPLREVSKREKIVFPIVVTVFVSLLVPSAAPLVGSLMLGNLFRESGVVERLSKCVQNELNNIVVIFLGVSVGATATADTFLSIKTLEIIGMGVVAFGMGTAGGVLLAKFMNLFLKNKINPLIGSAGVSAVPMAARVSQTVGQKENPKNFLLMHAMGPNVAGVIGSAIAAGVLIALFG